jgi:hypothetical protein
MYRNRRIFWAAWTPTRSRQRSSPRRFTDARSVLPGANPTTGIYNPSAAKIYNASTVIFYKVTSNLVRFESKNILFCFEKPSSLLQSWRCSCIFRSRRIGSRILLVCTDSWGANPICYFYWFQLKQIFFRVGLVQTSFYNKKKKLSPASGASGAI